MPLYYFTCPSCQRTKKLILSPEESEDQVLCPHESCRHVEMFRDPKPPSSHVKETMDNGVAVRPVEQFKDIGELQVERSSKNPRET